MRFDAAFSTVMAVVTTLSCWTARGLNITRKQASLAIALVGLLCLTAAHAQTPPQMKMSTRQS
jgi:hypothetical protein